MRDCAQHVEKPIGGLRNMGKTGRKRRSRRKKSANHGKRPNS